MNISLKDFHLIPSSKGLDQCVAARDEGALRPGLNGINRDVAQKLIAFSKCLLMGRSEIGAREHPMKPTGLTHALPDSFAIVFSFLAMISLKPSFDPADITIRMGLCFPIPRGKKSIGLLI